VPGPFGSNMDCRVRAGNPCFGVNVPGVYLVRRRSQRWATARSWRRDRRRNERRCTGIVDANRDAVPRIENADEVMSSAATSIEDAARCVQGDGRLGSRSNEDDGDGRVSLSHRPRAASQLSIRSIRCWSNLRRRLPR
jgi:hypothetical protein